MIQVTINNAPDVINGDTANFTISYTGTLEEGTIFGIALKTVNGTAIAGTDYVYTSELLEFEYGEATSQVFSVPVIQLSLDNITNKTFSIIVDETSGDADFELLNTIAYCNIIMSMSDSIPITEFLECCKYPTWLEEMKQEAMFLSYKQITTLINDSYLKESYGKECYNGYHIGLKFNALINYCCYISLLMREEEESGFVRTPEEYYEKFFLNKIINYFRCLKINIKPILSIFKIDEYNRSLYNFDEVDWTYNIELPLELILDLKTFKTYFSNATITLNADETKSNLLANQVDFILPYDIYRLHSFLINGNDRTEKTTYVDNILTYTPTGGTFPYNIQLTDTIIINFTYES